MKVTQEREQSVLTPLLYREDLKQIMDNDPPWLIEERSPGKSREGPPAAQVTVIHHKPYYRTPERVLGLPPNPVPRQVAPGRSVSHHVS